MAELKPCPACGEADLLCMVSEPYDGQLVERAECSACGVSGPRAATSELAVESWNALPSEERWVPVSEATPELYSSVEVWCPGEGRGGWCCDVVRGAKDSWWWDGQRLHGVTHWRPVTPPRGPEATDG